MKKKTFFKAVVTVMVAIMLLMSMNLLAFASITEDSDTSSIVVSKLEAGVTVTAYQIIVVNYNYSSDQPSDPMYSWANSSIESWVSSNYSDYADVEEFANVTDADTLVTFYSKLAAAIKSSSVTVDTTYSATADGTATYPVTEDALTESVTLSGVEMGQYLLVTEGGYRVYTPATVSVVPEYDETNGWTLASSFSAEVKSKTPQVSKTLSDGSTTDNYSTTDTISYIVTSDIPTYASDSTSTIYVLTDSVGTGQSIDTTSIKVYGVSGDDEVELDRSAYTITATSSGYTITFTYSSISSYDSIKVTYDATLNQDSSLTLGSSGNTSTVSLEYSNNPYSSGTQTISDTTSVTIYTYGVKVIKVDNSDTEKTLEGAQFTLLDSSKSTLYFVKSGDIYYLASSSTSGADTTLETNSEGQIIIYGLDEGTYYLQETKAADGYYLDSTKQTITITDEDLDGLLDNVDNDDDGIYEITVKNKTGIVLPTTGGIGTTIFVATGVVLIVAGLSMMIITSKKKKNNIND